MLAYYSQKFIDYDIFCFNKKKYDTCLMQQPRGYAMTCYIVARYSTLEYE